MLRFSQPGDAEVRRFLEARRGAPFSYAETGASRDGAAAPGYNADHHRILLGSGEAAFRRAVEALRSWKMFDVSLARLCWPSAPIVPGTPVVVLARHFGLWSINCCRVVYVIDEPPKASSTSDVARFGFAYGALAEHMESGEERFLVEWDRASDSVSYDLFAFSRPRHPLARLAKPLARRLQRQFARESLAAMRRAVAG